MRSLYRVAKMYRMPEVAGLFLQKSHTMALSRKETYKEKAFYATNHPVT